MSDTRDDRGLWKKAFLTVPAIVIIGSAMGYLSNSGFSNDWYAALRKPEFQPPAWVFGAAWTALYMMMGIALAAILNEPDSPERRRALTLFGLQLGLNFGWSPIFFGARMIDLALVVIVLMLVLALATARAFKNIRKVAGYLLVPYLLWLCLATALNYETGRLNPGADARPLGITGA
ncbi:MAG TPA: TspO/MBR family protein [Sphingomicrobium sp.]|nr:TspO/MBR family protein [Sphingomicrobium sp.]